MERLSGQSEIHLDWKPNRFVQSFTGVLEALAVLIFCFVHHIVIRVLRRSGLSTPCSCPARIRKHLMPILDHSFGSEDNCCVDHFEGFSKEMALEGFAELSTAVCGVNTRISMAESRYSAGGDDGPSGYITPAEDLTDQEQRDIDHDQDVKDRELFEALQRERETLAVLYSELEQERNCSATAASEALAMISRLQEEKAAVQLEARQFQRMVLEKAMYDQEAIEALNELLVSREEEKLALEEEIRLCREKLDSVMREERRQSLIPKEKADEGRVSQPSKSPIPIGKEKIITTPRAGREEQLICVDKFSTTKSQVLTALVQDDQLGLGRKFAKPEERDDDKPEFPGFVSLRRRWGSQEVSLKTLEQTREERLIEERQIEERRIEEKRLSVLEYVMRFEQQQKGVRLPVRMPSATRHPKSAEDSRSKSCDVDIDNSTSSIKSKWDEPISRVLATDDSLRRRLFEEEDFDEEQKSKASSLEEGMEDGGKCEEHPSISANGYEVMASKVCSGTDKADECVEKALVVYDVYEVQKSPYEVPAPVVGDAEVQPATPSDRLGKPDLQTFERFEDRDCLCLIDPSKSQEEVENAEKDLHWEDLQGKVKYKTLRVSKSLRIRDNSRPQVEEEVQELIQRLQALEADKFFMKQTIESLRRENGEMKLLQDLTQQFRELGSVEQQEVWPRRTPMTLQFQVHS